MQPLAVFRGSDAFLLLEHSAEMLGVFEAEAVRHLRHRLPGGKPVLGKPDDEAADVVACRVAGGLFDYVTEIVGRHAKFVRAILHGRQAKRKLELLVVIIPQQVFEAGQNIGILDFTCGKLAVVETLAKVEGKLDVVYQDGVL